jgi:hypothetical protein
VIQRLKTIKTASVSPSLGADNFVQKERNMNKKTVFGAVFLLLIQGAFLYADVSDDFIGFAHQRNWSRMERVLNNNKNRITDAEKTRISFMVSVNFRGDEAIRGFELLGKYNINPNPDSLFWAFSYSQPDNVIDYLWAIRGVEKDAAVLKQAIQNKRFNYVHRLLDIENIDLNQRVTRANFRGRDADYPIRAGWTALIWAVQMEHFDTVRRLVERGANVNLRDDNGETAASMAYDKGLIDVYNYLKANGAIDFEPRQVVQQSTPAPATPSSTTNVYVQPSAPAQSSPAPTPSTPTLQTGRYAWSNSGTNMNMTLISGIVTAYINNSLVGVWNGTYQIDGSQLVITVSVASGDYASMRGRTFSYNITSSTSFSGSGETWVRIGN